MPKPWRSHSKNVYSFILSVLFGENMRRDPMCEFTCQLASLEPPPPEMQQLVGALAGKQADTDRFFGVITGTVPVPEFFAPENMQRIINAA